MAKRPAPAYRDGFGIMNPYGGMWTPDVFGSEAAARKHIEDFWGKDEARVAGFRIVIVRQRTSFLRESDPSPSPLQDRDVEVNRG